MTQKNTSKTSKAADDASSDNSVLDFLYNDARRIGAFLSQFENVGHLKEITQTKDGSRGKREGTNYEGKGNLGVASGKYESSTETSVDMAQGYARVFDPYWSNARDFLNFLEERNLIQRDITSARIGQFVLVKGSLIVADMQAYQEVWKSDIVRKFILASISSESGDEDEGGNRHQRRAQKATGKNSTPTEADLVLELLPYLPHSPQFHIVGDEFAAWGTVVSENMVGLIADLMLKHGAKIAGEWSMLGILDGLPYETGDMPTTMELLRIGMTTDNISKLAVTMAPQIRNLLGRPLLSYGVTPLLVFRQIV